MLEDLAPPSVFSEPAVDEAKLVREELMKRILQKQRTIAEERALMHVRKSDSLYPLAEKDPLPELPLSHIICGNPGVIRPLKTSYQSNF